MAKNQFYMRIGLVLFVLAAKASIVYADRVSGTVTPIPDDDKFIIRDSNGETVKTVKLSETGRFTVFLKPGLYTAESNGRRAVLRSESVPLIDQRIVFE